MTAVSQATYRKAARTATTQGATAMTDYDIRVSTGGEIGEPGRYALYLTIATEDEIDGAAHVWPSDGSLPDDLDLDVAIDYMLSKYHVPRDAWQIAATNPAVIDGLWWVPIGEPDIYDGYTIARASLPDSALLAWPEVRLYAADSAEDIGPATRGQVAASIMAEDRDGGAGIILVDEDGTPVPAGSWDAQRPGVRRVYAA